MDTNRFREEAFEYALAQGCAAAELVENSGRQFGVGVLKGEIDTYTVSRSRSLGLRVQLDGKNGYAGTEAPEDPKERGRAPLGRPRGLSQSAPAAGCFGRPG